MTHFYSGQVMYFCSGVDRTETNARYHCDHDLHLCFKPIPDEEGTETLKLMMLPVVHLSFKPIPDEEGSHHLIAHKPPRRASPDYDAPLVLTTKPASPQALWRIHVSKERCSAVSRPAGAP